MRLEIRAQSRNNKIPMRHRDLLSRFLISARRNDPPSETADLLHGESAAADAQNADWGRLMGMGEVLEDGFVLTGGEVCALLHFFEFEGPFGGGEFFREVEGVTGGAFADVACAAFFELGEKDGIGAVCFGLIECGGAGCECCGEDDDRCDAECPDFCFHFLSVLLV